MELIKLSTSPMSLLQSLIVIIIVSVLKHYSKKLSSNTPDKGQTSLPRAVKNGNVVEVKSFLRYMDFDAQTSLSYAAENGQEAVAARLLARNQVDPLVEDYDGQCPLLQAARNGHQAIVKLFIDHHSTHYNKSGLWPMSRTHSGWDDVFIQALFQAIKNGNDAVVEILLASNRFDVNASDPNGHTLLYWAAENGYEAMVRLLLANHLIDTDCYTISQDLNFSRIFHSKKSRDTLLSPAAMNGHVEVVKLLLADGRIDVNSYDSSNGYTPLSPAAMNGHVEVVKLLLADSRIDINSVDFSNSYTPLSLAAKSGQVEVVELLLADSRVNVNSHNYFLTCTLLSLAARNGHAEVVKLLLNNNKFNINAKGPTGRMLLASAAQNRNKKAAQCFLDNSSDNMNAKICVRGPPLWATNYRYETVIELFLSDNWASVSPETQKYLIVIWQIMQSLMQLARRLHTFLRGGISLDRFSEFPNRLRPPCTTMPWNVRLALVVLWGVCWMFYPPLGTPGSTENFLDQDLSTYPDISLHDFSWENFPYSPQIPQYTTQENHNLNQLSHDIESVENSAYPPQMPQYLTQQNYIHNQLFHNTEGFQNHLYPRLYGNAQEEYYPNIAMSISYDHPSSEPLQWPLAIGDTPRNYGLPFAATEGQPGIPSIQQSVYPNLDITSTAMVTEINVMGQPIMITEQPTQNLDDTSEQRREAQGEITCDCSKCNGAIVSKTTWKAHNDRRLRQYTCAHPGCRNRSFGSRGDLKRHTNRFHAHSNTFYCPEAGCPRSQLSSGEPFFRKDHLYNHVKSKHKDYNLKDLKYKQADNTPARGSSILNSVPRRIPTSPNRPGEAARNIRERRHSRDTSLSAGSASSANEGSRRRLSNEELRRKILTLELDLGVLEKMKEEKERELEEYKQMAADRQL